jgi:hypothetical protein
VIACVSAASFAPWRLNSLGMSSGKLYTCILVNQKLIWCVLFCAFLCYLIALFISKVPLVAFNPLEGCGSHSPLQQVGGFFKELCNFYVDPAIIFPGLQIFG